MSHKLAGQAEPTSLTFFFMGNFSYFFFTFLMSPRARLVSRELDEPLLGSLDPTLTRLVLGLIKYSSCSTCLTSLKPGDTAIIKGEKFSLNHIINLLSISLYILLDLIHIHLVTHVSHSLIHWLASRRTASDHLTSLQKRSLFVQVCRIKGFYKHKRAVICWPCVL